MTNKDIVQKIIQAAQSYEKGLIGKTFMYVFDRQQIEVTYRAANFCHLTGVGTRLSARDFFDKALRGVLSEKEISFSRPLTIHSRRDVGKKVDHLICMADMVTGECFMLKDINTNSILLKYGVTDLNFAVCFDINVNSSSQNANFFFPRTLRHGDNLKNSQTEYTVTHIFCKRSDKRKYDTALYIEKGETLCGLPNAIKGKLNSHLAKGEKFIESCQYLFRESERILDENPNLYKEFLHLRQKYLKSKNLSPSPNITDNMTLAEKFKATEDYYNELCGIITFDEDFKTRYTLARDTYRENHSPKKDITNSDTKPKTKHKR